MAIAGRYEYARLPSTPAHPPRRPGRRRCRLAQAARPCGICPPGRYGPLVVHAVGLPHPDADDAGDPRGDGRDWVSRASDAAKEIIGTAIQRYAQEETIERTVSVVNLPNDEMKGRIIGREGRNIRAIEQATGVDLLIDDTPETITISCFDPIRR